MFDIRADFTLHFTDEASALFYADGLSLRREGKFLAARRHFATKKSDLWMYEDEASWMVERYHRHGAYLTGVIRAIKPPYFEFEHIFIAAAKLGATLILATVKDSVQKVTVYAATDGAACDAKDVVQAIATNNSNVALGSAVINGMAREVNNLLAKGADPNISFSDSSLVALAANASYIDITLALLDAGADPDGKMAPSDHPDAEEPGGGSALHGAVTHKNFSLLSTLLDAGANPNLTDGSGRTPLHLTVLHSSTYDLATKLIQQGATLNEPHDKKGLTPFLTFLSYAMPPKNKNSGGPKEVAATLKLFDLMVAQGVSVDDTSREGGNANWYSHTHPPLHERIVAMGCNERVGPNTIYSDKLIAHSLMTAMFFYDKKRFGKEMARFGDITQKERDELLFFAVKRKRLEAAKAFAEAGADPNAAPIEDIPTWQYAERDLDDREFVAWLKEKAGGESDPQRADSPGDK